MKEFDYELKNIFSGLIAKRSNRKKEHGLLECHNLEPVEDDYVLHKTIIDMNVSGYDWGNDAGVDYWIDTTNDVWLDNDNDNWIDI